MTTKTVKTVEEARLAFDNAMMKYLSYLDLTQAALRNKPSTHVYPEFHSVAEPFADLLGATIEKREAEIRKEERAFILNVLDGIDIADGECNTKAIRECLKARVV
jgi:hypothetical protein